MESFNDKLAKSQVILADGAMGTILHARGIGFDKCFDELNLSNPGAVAEIHRAYIEAGAQLIITNTFGANRFKLGKHGLQDHVDELNRAGVDLAKRVVSASFKEVLIAGDVGPLGVRIAPYGRVKPEVAREAFAEQIRALAESGVNLIVLETFSDLYEIKEAIKAARHVVRSRLWLPLSLLPVMIGRCWAMILSWSPADSMRAGVDVIGVNCSGGPAQLLRLLKQMNQQCRRRTYG